MNAKAIATIILTFFAHSVQEEDFLFHVHLYENYISHVDILVILSLKDQRDNPQCEIEDTGPLTLNAFDMIMLSQGLNLATIFDRGQVFPYCIIILLFVCYFYDTIITCANSQISAHLMWLAMTKCIIPFPYFVIILRTQ
jgi:hypothetical protein